MVYNKKEILKLLDNKNIKYKYMEHEAVSSIEEIENANIPKSEQIAVNLFVTDRKRENFYLIVANSMKKVDLKQVREKIGSKRLSFASSEDLMKYFKVKPGAVSLFGALNDKDKVVRIYIDEFYKNRTIGLHPNDNTASIWMETNDLVEIINENGNLLEYIEI
ncbi:prolyl-tRNA synthetase associated domain-containing protein [Miniphocaeibacter halophilus]|uniref:Prolyl-tRNA synthetase associated domain-containing protein n=1 Tax=Miniphocaeibacter halophilus TaxID=2931922 RepID=A0AC61N008_9FIRM|nr:YbaK/EbsC family protein [Miniphocaeibacter halophilus]QQK08426.1 prolyl-tRNA synthetase associated domain-containing protein [Miniphocaeibacter halophilus]